MDAPRKLILNIYLDFYKVCKTLKSFTTLKKIKLLNKISDLSISVI